MTIKPAQIARAAEIIREHAQATSGGAYSSLCWFDADVDLRHALRSHYGMYERDDCDARADARWIADMSPSLGMRLADLVEALNHAVVQPEHVAVAKAASRAIAQEILDNALCSRLGL